MSISFSAPTNRNARARGAGVTAVLGPTNTGKTHLAIERMLGHSSGIIGLPLRLLAREVYNKVADRVGAESVALITGAEKIKPANPRYWVSTVEAMPRELGVAGRGGGRAGADRRRRTGPDSRRLSGALSWRSSVRRLSLSQPRPGARRAPSEPPRPAHVRWPPPHQRPVPAG